MRKYGTQVISLRFTPITVAHLPFCTLLSKVPCSTISVGGLVGLPPLNCSDVSTTAVGIKLHKESNPSLSTDGTILCLYSHTAMRPITMLNLLYPLNYIQMGGTARVQKVLIAVSHTEEDFHVQFQPIFASSQCFPALFRFPFLCWADAPRKNMHAACW